MDFQVIYPDAQGIIYFTIVKPIPPTLTNPHPLGTTTKKVTGKEVLVQLVYVELLKSPGRDIQVPTDGGGIYSMTRGYNVDVNNIPEIYADITSRVRIVEKQILTDQMNKGLALDEMLQKLNIKSVMETPGNPTGYYVQLEIISADEDISSPIVMVSSDTNT